MTDYGARVEGRGRRLTRASSLWGLVSFLVVAVLAPVPAVADSHIFVVDSTGDEDATDPSVACPPGEGEVCTLRAAIDAGNASGAPYEVRLQLFATITLTGDLPTITEDATILGTEGAADFIVIDGDNNSHLIFDVADNVDLTVRDLTLANGAGAINAGCPMATTSSVLSIERVTFSDNITGDRGGGAVCSNGDSVTVADSVFQGNRSGDTFGGGGLAADSDVTVTGSTFSGNAAGNDGGAIETGGPSSPGDLSVTASTFTGNAADADGGGTFGEGSAVKADGTLTVTNSTFEGNATPVAGASAINAQSGGTITNSTIVNPGSDRGLRLEGGTLDLHNTIIWGHTGDSDCSVGGGTLNSDGNYNLDGDGTCFGTPSADDHASASAGDLNLDTLRNNGGSTQTRALFDGSVAVGAGNNVTCPSTDQRGVSRPQSTWEDTPTCDIGAFELRRFNTDTFEVNEAAPPGAITLDAFDAAGLAQIQVIDDNLTKDGSQYELSGELTNDDEVSISLELSDLEPVILIGTGKMVSYAITEPGADQYVIDATIRPAPSSHKNGCFVGGDCSGQADFTYASSLSLAADPMNYPGTEAFAAAAHGMWIMTDAQGFGVPTWDPVNEALALEVAAPAEQVGGSANDDGFFDAFIPDAMFTDFFDVDPAAAEMSVTRDGSAEGLVVEAQLVTGGVLVEVSGIGYSTPTIRIHADEKQDDGGGGGSGGGGGGGTGTIVDRPVVPGIPVSTGTDATNINPTQTSITSPVPGTVTVEQARATTTELPSGQTALDIEVEITAPPATPEEPLELGFELDASVLEDVDLDRLVVYRNGEPVPGCTEDIGAVPDPCLAASGTQDDGDLELTVRTSEASTWNFGTVETACPVGLVAADGFEDVEADATHAAAIDCAVWWGLVSGTETDSFDPGGALTRGQVATVLFEAIDAAGAFLPFSEDQFADVGDVHGDAIERLAAAGILSGRTEGIYEPIGTVTRGQAATLLVEVYEHVAETELTVADADPFEDDDASPHESNIRKAVEAGLVNGTGATTFEPAAPVTRGQLASFVTNLLDRLVDDGLAAPPL